MLTRWQRWFAAVTVTLITVGLAILDLTDASLRRWWGERDFTTSVAAGILVRLDDAVDRLRAASIPLLKILDPEQRIAVTGDAGGTAQVSN